MSNEPSVMFEQQIKILTDKIRAVYNREVADPEFKPHKEFESEKFPNIARIKSMFGSAIDGFLYTTALASNIHGETNHEREYPEEKEFLEENTTIEQQTMAEVEADTASPSFWRN